MLLGFISDIHANLPALEAVLGDVETQSLDALICLGDFVGYGADPNEVFELASNRCDLNLVGNHDLAAIGALETFDFNLYAQASVEWTAKTLSPSAISALSALRPRRDAFGLVLAHASPRDPISEYVSDAQIAAENLAGSDFEIAVVGHTHVPAVFASSGQFVTVERIRDGKADLSERRAIVNPGSVGQPRDGDARASWATFDSQSSVFEVRRVEYDVRRAQAAIREAGLPDMLAARLEEGK